MMSRDPGLDPSSPHLSHERLPRVARPIEAHYRVAGAQIPARVEDVSEGGAYIDTVHPLRVGTTLTLELGLPNGGPVPTSIRAEATVVWALNGLGAGVAFRELSEEARSRLRYYMASVLFGHLP